MKTVLVVLDGLSFKVARECMGFLQALCHEKQGKLYSLECELPSLSRPLYECILTGINPVNSGISHNGVSRLSHNDSIFSYARKAGLTTAAAAYHWVSELYNRGPFNPLTDRLIHDDSLPIQYGLFYWQDNYPDSHLFADAHALMNQHHPDFLLVHSMNIDDAGHHYGLDSGQYRNFTRLADIELSNYLPSWRLAGYQVIVTADHGMNNDKTHGGILQEERQVPFFVFGEAFSYKKDVVLEQKQICGTVCEILQVPHQRSVCPLLLV